MKLTPEEKRLRALERGRKSYWKHRDRYLAEYREKHPKKPQIPPDEKIKRRRAAVNRSYAKHIERNREKKRANYKATKHWLYVRNRRAALQEIEATRPRPTCCEVCGDDKARIEFDHCHQRGVFRGWLCTHCNVILGHARDEPNRLRKLIAYLERTKDLTSPQLTLPV